VDAVGTCPECSSLLPLARWPAHTLGHGWSTDSQAQHIRSMTTCCWLALQLVAMLCAGEVADACADVLPAAGEFSAVRAGGKHALCVGTAPPSPSSLLCASVHWQTPTVRMHVQARQVQDALKALEPCNEGIKAAWLRHSALKVIAAWVS
jgi:hypothetical protein